MKIKSTKRKITKYKPLASRKKTKQLKALSAQTESNKRGVRVDFTTMRQGTKTEFDKVISVCPECGQKGQLSDGDIWGMSVLFIHRGLLKDNRLKMTEMCVATRLDVKL